MKKPWKEHENFGVLDQELLDILVFALSKTPHDSWIEEKVTLAAFLRCIAEENRYRKDQSESLVPPDDADLLPCTFDLGRELGCIYY